MYAGRLRCLLVLPPGDSRWVCTARFDNWLDKDWTDRQTDKRTDARPLHYASLTDRRGQSKKPINVAQSSIKRFIDNFSVVFGAKQHPQLWEIAEFLVPNTTFNDTAAHVVDYRRLGAASQTQRRNCTVTDNFSLFKRNIPEIDIEYRFGRL